MASRVVRRLSVPAILATIAACSSGDNPSELLGTTQEALTTSERILSFEGNIGGSSGDWQATAGAAVRSTLHSDQAYSISLSGNWNPAAASIALPALGTLSGSPTVDVQLPSGYVTQGTWAGQVALSFTCPSSNIFNLYHGPVPLLTQTGVFKRYTLPALPSNLKTALQSQACTITVLLNLSNSGAKAVQVDRLFLGQSSGGSGGASGSAGSAGKGGSAGAAGSAGKGGTGGTAGGAGAGSGGAGAAGSSGSSGKGGAGTGGTQGTGGAGSGGAGGSGAGAGGAPADVEYFIELPVGVARESVAIGAYGAGLNLKDNFEIRALPSGFSSASSVRSSSVTELGVSADVQHLWSHPNVLLRNNALVHGNALTEGTVEFQSGAAILGSRLEGVELDPIQHLGWTINFPSMNQGSLDLAPSGTRTISAGAFAGGTLGTAARLTLSTPGIYTLAGSLTMEPSSILDIDNRFGSVEIYLRDGFTFRGQISLRDTAKPNVLIGVGGAAPVAIDAPFRGILVAPRAAVTLISTASGHAGAVYAKSILANPNTIFTHTPATPTNFCTPSSPCSGLCPCNPGGGCDDDGDCSNGVKCVNGVCGGGGGPCVTTNQCAPGLTCFNGHCTNSCTVNPNLPECLPPHCSNGVKDSGEADVDCGGSCPGCDPGDDCVATADCADGLECGTNNGACFGGGKPRSQRVCWPTVCSDGVDPSECGQPDSPCGQNCSCFNDCDTDDPLSTCPPGEVCKRGLGSVVGGSTRDVCTDVGCPSNEPSLCGSKSSLCGDQCVCTPNCAAATCENPGDGCKGECRAVCNLGDPCTKDLHCPDGSSCPLTSSGPRVCRPDVCSEHIVRPPLCGAPGALCGDECPACTPQCDGKQCGLDANCGKSCGTCAAGTSCNGAGQCVPPTSDPPATGPTGDGGTGNIPDLPGIPASGVGALAGQFAVTEQGTAAYTIPIEVPPGRAGLEPSLSLRYSASRTPGDLGAGWHIDGLSRITRCARTYALDGYAAPVKNDDTDRFCLDGKRLSAISGIYGANGAEYRTVVDSFSKVKSYLDTNVPGIQLDALQGFVRAAREKQGPDYFEVWTKDGRVLTFGKTRDSLVVGFSGVRQTWLLNRVEDRAGNNILIQYETAGSSVLPRNGAVYPGAARPSVVSYTGHGEAAGNREVRFTYESRQDPSLRYFQGGLAAMTTERLSRITTYVNAEPVKNYRLDYRPQVLSQVQAIAECAGGDDTVCKPSTKFGYVEESGFEEIKFAPFIANSSSQLDVNGDGFPDFIHTSTTIDGVPAKPGLIAAQISTEVAVFVATTFILAPEIGVPVSIAYAIAKPFFWGIWADEPKIVTTNTMLFGSSVRPPPAIGSSVTGLPCGNGFPMYLLDVDRDGRDDVVGRCVGSRLLHSLSTGDGHFQPASNPIEPFAQLELEGVPGASIADPKGPAPIMYDVDGDRLEDIVSCVDKKTLEFRRRLDPTSPTSSFAPPVRLTVDPAFPLPPPLDSAETLPLCDESRPTHNILDLDGDGTSELVAHGKAGWMALRYRPGSSSPLAWEPVAFENWNSSELGRGLQLGDLNADGLTDISSVQDDKATIWMNTGGGAFSPLKLSRPRPAPTGYAYHQSALLDYDADGRTDLLEKWLLDGFSADFHFNVALRPTSDLSELLPVEAADIQARNALGILLPAEFNTSGDVDADGNADLIGPQGIFYGKGAKNMLLSRVEDGLGNVINVTYDEQGTYNQTCTGSTWPETCLRRMNNLVSGHTEGVIDNDGTSEVVEREYKYAYWNARYNVTGHGWLGFERRRMLGPEATITTEAVPPVRYTLGGGVATTTPPYVYPLAGLPARVVVDRYRGKSELESAEFQERTRTENGWDVGLSADSKPFPKLTTRTTVVYDREVPPLTIPPTVRDFEDNGIELTDHLEEFDYDGYGNVEFHNQRFVSRSETAFERITTTTSFAPNAETWLISNPERTQIQSDRGGESRTQIWDPTYDQAGLLSSVARTPDGPTSERHTTTYVRDEFGNPLQIIESVASGEAPRTTTVTYDADHVFPLTITNALGHMTQVRFDHRWGSPKTIVDPNGIAVRHAYDGLGLLAETHDPEGVTVHGYSAHPPFYTEETPIGSIRPRLRVTTDRQGTAGTRTGTEVRELDNLSRPVRTTSEGFGGAEVVREQSYDARGRMVGMTEPHTAGALVVPTAALSYDGFDRVTRMERSDGSVVERQYATRETLVPERQPWLGGIDCTSSILPCVVGVELTIDEEGRRDVQVSDHRGLVLRSIDGENVDTTTRSSNYVYGAFNRLKTTSDNAGHLTSFAHDAYGRRTAHFDPDIGQTLYFYNGYDELKTSIDPSQQRLFDYDSLGRIASILDASGQTTWIYDQGPNGLGQLSEMSSPATPENPAGQHVRYAYEPPTAAPNRGLLKTLDYVIDGVSYPITFGYDDLGRTDRIDYPERGSGPAIAAKYQYDTSGVLTGVDEVGGSATRQLWRMTEAFQGHLTQKEIFGNGAETTYAYDPQRRWLDSIGTSLGGTPIQSLSYTHHDNGLIFERTSNGLKRAHTYDDLNRLYGTVDSNAGVPVASASYLYDPSGNITQRGSKVLTYQTAKPHFLDTVDGNAYQYDPRGNVRRRAGPDIPGGLQVIDYTPFDLPKTITTGQNGSAKTTRFEYTADEERLVRRDETTTRHFVTDLYQRLIDNNGSATLEERFQLYAGDRPIAEIVRKNGTDETLYVHTDELGSVSTLSNEAGSSFQQEFDVFGALLSSSDPELTRAGYTGHQHERDLGLIDMRGRMYDPLAGRFLSADPMSQAPFWSQGLNRYSYVFNDPVNNTDPSGFFSFVGGGLSIVAGYQGGAYLVGTSYGILAGVVNAGTNLSTTGATGLQGMGSAGSTVAGGPLGSAVQGDKPIGPNPDVNTQLPASGTGYVAHSAGPRRWGTKAVIEHFQYVAFIWHLSNPDNTLVVGDISKRGGGPLETSPGKFHKSHKAGVDIDVQVLNKARKPLWRQVKVTDPGYDRAKTQEFIDLLEEVAGPRVKVIGTADAANLRGPVQNWSDHVYHLHIRFGP